MYCWFSASRRAGLIDALSGHNRGVILVLFTIALLLSIYPLPVEWRWWRPEFVMLVVIYWVYILPDNFSLGLIWVLGLLQDLIVGAPFGQHALGMVIVAYICLQSYQRVRNYSRWQQSCWVFVLVGISQIIVNWVYTMAGSGVTGLLFLYPAFTSALLWPVQLLRGVDRH
jgi:rod shape-determining protein MreD